MGRGSKRRADHSQGEQTEESSPPTKILKDSLTTTGTGGKDPVRTIEDPKDLNHLTVAELKEKLNSFGKKVTGKKSELVKRLTMALASSSSSSVMVSPPLPSCPTSSLVVSGEEIPITFLTFPWETISHQGNIWEGRSCLPLPNHEVSYWEVTVSDLEKQYQYEYTQLGVTTAPPISSSSSPSSASAPAPAFRGEAEEKFYVDGLIGEIVHSWCGLFRGVDQDGEGIYSTCSSVSAPQYRIRLQDGDTIGFLADLRDPQRRTLTLIPRRNYSCDPSKPHTQPSLVFSSQLLKLWESSTRSFGKTSVVGRLPPQAVLYAYASVGQLGKRFQQKFLSHTSEFLSVQQWGSSGEKEEIRAPPVEVLEQFILTNPSTTLGPATLSPTPYDPSLLQRIEQAERAEPRQPAGDSSEA
jgi:hypothetical protein